MRYVLVLAVAGVAGLAAVVVWAADSGKGGFTANSGSGGGGYDRSAPSGGGGFDAPVAVGTAAAAVAR